MPCGVTVNTTDFGSVDIGSILVGATSFFMVLFFLNFRGGTRPALGLDGNGFDGVAPLCARGT